MVRDNSAVMDLTGVTTGQISVIIYTSNKTVASNSPGMGTVTITQAKPGIITYAPASQDIPTAPGQYWIRIEVDYSGTTPDYSDYIAWLIQS